MERMSVLFSAILTLCCSSPLFAKDAVVAQVDSEKILSSQVEERLWDLHGGQVVEAMIVQKLFEKEAKALGLTPDESEVSRRVSAIQRQLPEGVSLDERLRKTGVTLGKLRSGIASEVLRDEVTVRLAGIEVSSAEVRAAFDANRDRLGTPEAVRLRHILVQTRQEADDLLVALKAGADFAKLAQNKSLDAATRAQGGDLGFIARGMLRPELEKAVFELAAGAPSAPVQAPQGFHIFLPVEKRPARAASFEEVAPELYRALRAEKIASAQPRILEALAAKAKIRRTKPGRPKG